jgi:hypothetical protein
MLVWIALIAIPRTFAAAANAVAALQTTVDGNSVKF